MKKIKNKLWGHKIINTIMMCKSDLGITAHHVLSINNTNIDEEFEFILDMIENNWKICINFYADFACFWSAFSDSKV